MSTVGHALQPILWLLEILEPEGYRGDFSWTRGILRLTLKLILEYQAMCFVLNIIAANVFKIWLAAWNRFRTYQLKVKRTTTITCCTRCGLWQVFQYAATATATESFIKDTNNLEHKYGDNPLVLMESLRRADETFR